MNKNEFEEFFKRYEGNPILTPEIWPYKVSSVFNPGAIKFNNEVLLLVRVEDREGHSHLTIATSKDGKTNWHINPEPALAAEPEFGEAIFGLEDPRIVWSEERQEYMITCVSFFEGVAGEPPGISLITTKDFSDFKRLGRQLIPPNKDASLLPKTIKGYYALIHRPIVDGRTDIWVSFSKDLNFWGKERVLIPARNRTWDNARVGLGPPPIETPEGWLVIYHGAKDTASGTIYRVGLVLLDLETLEVIRRSRDWVFGPKEYYERVGDVDDIVFPCGAIVDEKTNELLVYYGAADSVVALATANLDDVLTYLKKCTEY
ncbi:glycosidase [Patescibacteria group bacterium]|nr:glycosidase [Patescibacteria group bacterium]MBU4274426.1 glycosidase [Patescibacteria group bacterium]MBU4368058.1 glycosidase [Patescibacteria group bacterium]MBU4462229.1 glycosidase [Patescibacteria group bacterium]MCG2699585.1 glycosidase [Candidatus Parcubacteria bacterium]